MSDTCSSFEPLAYACGKAVPGGSRWNGFVLDASGQDQKELSQPPCLAGAGSAGAAGLGAARSGAPFGAIEDDLGARPDPCSNHTRRGGGQIQLSSSLHLGECKIPEL